MFASVGRFDTLPAASSENWLEIEAYLQCIHYTREVFNVSGPAESGQGSLRQKRRIESFVCSTKIMRPLLCSTEISCALLLDRDQMRTSAEHRSDAHFFSTEIRCALRCRRQLRFWSVNGRSSQLPNRAVNFPKRNFRQKFFELFLMKIPFWGVDRPIRVLDRPIYFGIAELRPSFEYLKKGISKVSSSLRYNWKVCAFDFGQFSF